MSARILAETAPVGDNAILWIGPIIIAASLVAWLVLTVTASFKRIHPERRMDQSTHRGPVQGGFYTYWSGMFSHSYPPGEVTGLGRARQDQKDQKSGAERAEAEKDVGRDVARRRAPTSV